MKYIPYGKQLIDEEDIQSVIEVLRSDFLTTGPKINEFEETLARYVHARYAVAVSNGTAALHLACLATGIKNGDEVITSPITFAASANCILYCGAKPVFADIDPVTYNIDPKDVRKKITRNTKAIIPVHFTGQPCDMDEIRGIAEEHNLIVIEDAAHALGAEYKGKRIGGISDMTTFSFHPVKHITTGEGGAITTNDEELYNRLMLYRNHGITRDPSMMLNHDGGWYYEMQELGYNYRITDFQCALGISQFKKLDGFIARRHEIARVYDKAFHGLKDLVIPAQSESSYSSYHLYVVQLQAMDRKIFYDSLRDSGIGVNVHYIPVYKHPYYQRNGFERVCCENAEGLYKKLVSLPIFPALTKEEQGYVIEQVERLLR
ncbi:MAG TPA: UDP-4-amino-4,6-dideoxy-N-acetyl-beta-L-altrosamine transaminase [Bacillota bacterium]|nr:UDP-4-amino-4,6-dideoxy-N-acetyl-beta-L-altrosamine transaminase [Bacillota bacterium]